MLELEQCKDYVCEVGGSIELFRGLNAPLSPFSHVGWWCRHHCFTGCMVPPYRLKGKGPSFSTTGLSDLHSSTYRKLAIGSYFHPHLTHLCHPCGDVLPHVQRDPRL